MKAIKDMSREELIGLIYNNFEKGTVNIFDKEACCVMCGTKEEALKAKWFYICDKCNEQMKESDDKE